MLTNRLAAVAGNRQDGSDDAELSSAAVPHPRSEQRSQERVNAENHRCLTVACSSLRRPRDPLTPRTDSRFHQLAVIARVGARELGVSASAQIRGT